MGKSNNLYNNLTQYQKEHSLNNFLKKEEIQKLEYINQYFINNFIKKFSNFIKNNVKFISYNMNIKSYDFSKKNTNIFKYFNSIEILPYKNQSIIIYSHNFLPVIIDLLFGGSGHTKDKINNILDIRSTDFFIHKKIIKLITNIFSNAYKKYFSSDMRFVNIKMFIDFEKPNFNSNEIFLINCFNFNINNIEIFFSILFPLSMIQEINKKIDLPKKNNNKQIYLEQNTKNEISFNDIYNIELNIVARIIDISISCDRLDNLSVGDIISIKKPDKIIGFIENKPIFFANYKTFNEQSIIFIEEFINNNLNSNKNDDKE